MIQIRIVPSLLVSLGYALGTHVVGPWIASHVIYKAGLLVVVW